MHTYLSIAILDITCPKCNYKTNDNKKKESRGISLYANPCPGL